MFLWRSLLQFNYKKDIEESSSQSKIGSNKWISKNEAILLEISKAMLYTQNNSSHQNCTFLSLEYLAVTLIVLHTLHSFQFEFVMVICKLGPQWSYPLIELGSEPLDVRNEDSFFKIYIELLLNKDL